MLSHGLWRSKIWVLVLRNENLYCFEKLRLPLLSLSLSFFFYSLSNSLSLSLEWVRGEEEAVNVTRSDRIDDWTFGAEERTDWKNWLLRVRVETGQSEASLWLSGPIRFWHVVTNYSLSCVEYSWGLCRRGTRWCVCQSLLYNGNLLSCGVW